MPDLSEGSASVCYERPPATAGMRLRRCPGQLNRVCGGLRGQVIRSVGRKRVISLVTVVGGGRTVGWIWPGWDFGYTEKQEACREGAVRVGTRCGWNMRERLNRALRDREKDCRECAGVAEAVQGYAAEALVVDYRAAESLKVSGRFSQPGGLVAALSCMPGCRSCYVRLTRLRRALK